MKVRVAEKIRTAAWTVQYTTSEQHKEFAVWEPILTQGICGMRTQRSPSSGIRTRRDVSFDLS